MTNSFPSTGNAPVDTIGSLALSVVEALGTILTPDVQPPTIIFGTRRLSDWPADVKSLGPMSMREKGRSYRRPAAPGNHRQSALIAICSLLASKGG